MCGDMENHLLTSSLKLEEKHNLVCIVNNILCVYDIDQCTIGLSPDFKNRSLSIIYCYGIRNYSVYNAFQFYAHA